MRVHRACVIVALLLVVCGLTGGRVALAQDDTQPSEVGPVDPTFSAPVDAISTRDLTERQGEAKPGQLVQTPPEEPRQWHVGGSAAIGLMPMTRYGLEMNYTRWFSAGAGFGWLSVDRPIERETMTYSASSHWLTARIHPDGRAFFIGAEVGYQKMALSGSHTFKVATDAGTSRVPTDITVSVEKRYIAPKVGWFTHWPNGIAAGSEFGWQIPIGGVTSDYSVSPRHAGDKALMSAIRKTSSYRDREDAVKSGADWLGRSLPIEWTVLKVAWFY